MLRLLRNALDLLFALVQQRLRPLFCTYPNKIAQLLPARLALALSNIDDAQVFYCTKFPACFGKASREPTKSKFSKKIKRCFMKICQMKQYPAKK